MLFELAGNYPPKALYRTYNRWATINGYPNRTMNAMRVYAATQNLSLLPRFDTMSLTGLANAMGLSPQIVHQWHKRGWLKTSQERKCKQVYVTVTAFTEFAKQHPDRIRNVDPITLRSMVGNEVADLVLGTPKRVRKWKVYDRQTGISYPSMVHAMKGLYYGSDKPIKKRPERFKLTPVY